MKILIIGSKGFIGTHCIRYFASVGHDVWGCDVVTDYVDKKYLQVDATTSNYEEIFRKADFDVCVNSSGAASVPDSFVHPLRDFHLNVHNVYCMLDAIRKHNPACKFINLSSAAVYGNPDALPVSESASTHPLSPYGRHKLYSEQVCAEFYKHFQIKCCCLRIFSAFGTGLKKQIFWDWYQNIKLQPEMVFFGTGNESRDFIYIDDLVAAIDCVINNGLFAADIINVASGREIKISYAASVFISRLTPPPKYKFNMNVREGDPINWVADISKLKKMGFKPKISFEEGLNNYCQWAEKE